MKSKKTKPSKKTLLQKAALQTFIKSGYHQTRIEDISQRAKIGKGTFYLYFKNKEDVVHSLLDDFIEKFNELHRWVSQSLQTSSDINEIYSEEGQVILRLLEENRDLGFFLLREGKSISESMNKRITDFFTLQEKQAEQSYKLVQNLGLLRNIDPKYAALCVVGGILHIYNQWLEGKIKEPPAIMLQKTLGFYLQALAK